MTRATCLFVFMLACCAVCTADSNVDPAENTRYGWAENAGWADAYADGTNGVEVTPFILSGYIWQENVGWICLGDGTPDTPPQYSNASATDYGVNHDAAGHLSGYAWGENIGWVVFDTSGAGGSQVTISPLGEFAGYAWSENIGWINMASGYGVQLLDSDGDQIPDAFETDSGLFVSEYDTGTASYEYDSDGDDLNDGVEVHTYHTDPNDEDTDDDTITDGDEIHGVYEYVTNPLEEDTDGDTYDDWTEIVEGTDPTDPEDYPGSGLSGLEVPIFR